MLPPLEQTIQRFSEFELIARIRAAFSYTGASGEVVGVGDDAAVWAWSPRRRLVTTCDMLVQDVHFNLDWITPRQLGRRAAAVNLSDLAAMGAEPVFLLASLGLPGSLEILFFDDLTAGLREMADAFGARISGGNIAKTDKLIVDIFAAGRVEPERLILRKGAQAGDVIYITGALGGGMGGLLTLKHWGKDFPSELAGLTSSFLEPQPRVKAGRLLAATGWVTAMIDVSDGLSGDLRHICEAGGVGARLNVSSLPWASGLQLLAERLRLSPSDLALHGGDSYELLFTVKPGAPPEALAGISRECGLNLTPIGEIIPAGLEIETADGIRRPLQPKSWDHFPRN